MILIVILIAIIVILLLAIAKLISDRNYWKQVAYEKQQIMNKWWYEDN